MAEAAVVEAPNSLDTFNEKQRGEWLRNGTRQPKDEAEPAPAKEVESEPEKEAEAIAPAPDTGNQQESKPKGRADQRIQELLKERKELRARVEAAEKKAEKPAEPAPAAAAKPTAAAEPTDGRPVAPDASKWTGTWEELQAAQLRYIEDLTDWKLKQPDRDRAAAEKTAAEANERAIFDQWKERREAAVAADPEYADAQDIVGRFVTAKRCDSLIIESEVGPEIVMHLYRLPKEEQERVSKLSPSRLAREIVLIEHKLLALADEEKPSSAPATPQPRKTSAAAKPATELSGTRANNVVDEEAAAIASGNSAEYMRLANLRDLKKRK
jgi:hypothetical protein